MPRATVGLLAIVLWGCVPEGDFSSAESDQAARRGHHDRDRPWNPPRKGHWFHGPSGHDDGHDDTPTATDLLMCVEACNADEDDDGCGDDHHWWRHGGNRPDTQEECQALWDSLDDTERGTALADARDALAECGVDPGEPQGPTCESFVAQDDFFFFQLPRDEEGFPTTPPDFVEFDVFGGDEFGVDTALPQGAGSAVVTDSTRLEAPDVDLAQDGTGVWSGPEANTSRMFTYVACCVEPDGEANQSFCDQASVFLLAC